MAEYISRPQGGRLSTQSSFWDRVATEYKKYSTAAFERTAVSLETKWGDLQTQVNKFAACFIQVSTNPPSGTTLDDLIKMALELYSAKFNGKSFQYLGAWKVLKDSPKFCSTPSKKRSLSPGKLKSMKVEMDPTPSSNAVSSSSSADSQAADCKLFVEENKPVMKERPMGTKKAKKLQALVDARAARNQELNKIAESQDRIAAALTLKSRIALFASDVSSEEKSAFFSLQRQLVLNEMREQVKASQPVQGCVMSSTTSAASVVKNVVE
jgi:hypothetical protein